MLCVGLWLLWSSGFHASLLEHDQTFLGFFTFGLFMISTLVAGWKTWLFSYRDTYTATKKGWFLSETMLTIGMTGTFIGLILMFGESFNSIDVTNPTSMKNVVTDVASGLSTALYTTLVGLVCSTLLKLQLINLEDGTENYDGRAI
jgi:hypothetical protein